MKFNVKGLVFVGFAAAILSANAMAATGDEKIVTSKKYVDDTFQVKGSYEVTTAKETSKASLTTNKASTTNYPSNAAITGYVDDAISGQNLGNTYEVLTNKTQTVSSESTTSQYPSAKAVYDFAKDHQANVIETVKVNGTALTPTSKAVDITVPTATSALTNDSGFITKSVNDLTNYTTTTDMNTALADKQDKQIGTATTDTGRLVTVNASGQIGMAANDADVGSATKGVYIHNGVPTATTYSVAKDVPSDAVFTDTTYDTLTSEEITAGTGTTGRLITAAQYAAKQNASTAVKYAGSAVGSATTPVYVDESGNVTASTYTIETSVPANAVFTDTKYTADGTTITLSDGQFSATAGSVASGNTGLVNGGTVYSYINGQLVPVPGASCGASTPCALVATGATMADVAWVVMAQQ